jgi:Tol biopolymer transport system component
MDADGSHQRDLTSGSTAEESFPSWSAKPPFTIVFQSNRGKADVNDNDLYVMTADGRRATPLATTTAREEQPAWAAGIDKIAYTHSTRYDDHELFTMLTDGHEQALLGPSTLPLNATEPDWAPNAAGIAFTGVVPGTPRQVYSVRANATRLRRLTEPPGSSFDPAFSPDGKLIAFASDRDGGTAAIYVMKADGSAETRLTFGPDPAAEPAWQPSRRVVPLAVVRHGSGRITSTPSGIDCGVRCSASFRPDTVVLLVARPAADTLFTGWRGACSGTAPRCRLKLDSARSIEASFGVAARLRVETRGRGSVSCGAPCSGAFRPGAVVELTAVAAPGFVFRGWSGACSGHASTCMLTLRAGPTSVVATFSPFPHVSLEDAHVTARWRESVLNGTLFVRGRSTDSADVAVTVEGARSASFQLSLQDGAFAKALKLPPHLLPGRYLVRLAALSGDVTLAGAERTVQIVAPPEGVVAHAYISAEPRRLQARFEFAAQPRVGPIAVTWYKPDGGAAAAPLTKPRRPVVSTFVRAAHGKLQSGTWRCVLRAGGVVVARAAVRVG